MSYNANIMNKSLELIRGFYDEIDTEKFQYKFLRSLLHLQNVKRGSLWIKQNADYICIEAVGNQSETLKGLKIPIKDVSIVGWVIQNKSMTIANPFEDARHHQKVEEKFVEKSSLILCLPLFLKDNQVYGAIQIIATDPTNSSMNLSEQYLEIIQDLVDIGSACLGKILLYNQQLKQTQLLREELAAIRDQAQIIGNEDNFRCILETANNYAKTDFPVLITGDSGTGKELIAQYLHKRSQRHKKPFFVQNCSAIPELLLESELCGYKKGAFTGANTDKTGLFEEAHGGTIFLDEIGDMSIGLQAKILRIIQNGEIKPLGANHVVKVDVRIISATHQDLPNAITQNKFRQDLFYRLSVLPLRIPSLRERPHDILLLLDHFMHREAAKLNIVVKTFDQRSKQLLQTYHWPGNIRELENFVRFILVSANDQVIVENDLPQSILLAGDQVASSVQSDTSSRCVEASGGNHVSFVSQSWEDVERSYIGFLLEQFKWNISQAARVAKLNRSTFVSRMKKLSIGR